MPLNEAQQTISNRAGLLADTCQQFQQWMQQYPEIVNTRKDALNKAFWQHWRQASLIKRAAGRPVNIGVFGASQAGKSYLISALTRHPEKKRCLGQFGSHVLDFIDDMNPAGGEESTGIVSRFTLGKPDGVSERYPVRMQVLRRVELLKIIINAYLSDINLDGNLQLSEVELDKFLAQYDDIGDGEIDTDFYEIEDYFDTYFDNKIMTKVLKPYWKRLGMIAAALDGERKLAFYSIFWHFNTHFNELFRKLSTTLERLGNPEYISVGIEALSKEHNNGQNVLYASALQNIVSGSGCNIPLRLDNGNETSIDLAELAGLAIEITIVLPQSPDPLFSHTDLLDFPGARSRLNLRTRHDSGEFYNEAQFNTLIKDNLNDLFKRGKVDYLYQKYVDENEFTAMLLCMADGPQEVKTILAMIERWLHYTHGDSAKERQHSDAALFMVLTKMDLHLEKAGIGSINEIWTSRIHSSLIEPYGRKEKNWFNEWTPGKAFNNVFWLRNPDIAQASFAHKNGREVSIAADWQERLDKLQQSFINNASAQRHFADPAAAFAAALTPNDGGVSYILSHLAKVCKLDLKLNQLRMQMGKLTEKMRQQIGEFYKDGDLAKELQRRYALNRSVVNGLRYCYEMQRFGQLLQCLMVHESNVVAAIKKLHVTYDDHITEVAQPEKMQDWLDDLLGEAFALQSEKKEAVEQPKVVNKNRHLAEQVLNDWSTQVYDLGKNAKAQSFFNLDESTFTVFLNEIISGCHASRLTDTLAQVSEEVTRFPHRHQDIIHHHARQITSTLNYYLNFLHLKGRGYTVKTADSEEQPLFARPALEEGEVPQLNEVADENELIYCGHWLKAYVLRIEENVRYETDMMDINVQANDTLGKLLQPLKTA